MELEEYDYDLSHLSDEKNISADCLSRLLQVNEVSKIFIYNYQEIYDEQQLSLKLTNNNNFKVQIIQGHSLLVDTKERLVIPQSLANRFFQTFICGYNTQEKGDLYEYQRLPIISKYKGTMRGSY